MSVPTVDSIYKSYGSVNGNNTIAINGTNLQNVTDVYFGSNSAVSFNYDSPTNTIYAVVPSSSSANTVNVFVKSPAGTSSASNSNQYTYYNTPSITSITPSYGSITNGSTVTITGTSFTSSTTVKFGIYSGTNVVFVNTNTITVTPPNVGSIQTVSLSVTNEFGTSNSIDYSYKTTPTITNISNNNGYLNGGKTLTINGTGFASASSVLFGTVNVTNFTINSDSQIVVTTPAYNSTGIIYINVTNLIGTSNISNSTNLFTYLNTPTIDTIDVSYGSLQGSTNVNIYGTNIDGTTTVYFGTSYATSFNFVDDNQTQILAVSPPSTIQQSVYISLVSSIGTTSNSSSNLFTYVSTPVISSIDISQGLITGGSTVNITGSGLLYTNNVYFGNTSTTFTVSGDNQIITTNPSVTNIGNVNITVKNVLNVTSATSSNDLFYYKRLPSITNITNITSGIADYYKSSFSVGPLYGGSKLQLSGVDLNTVTNVYFGSVSATFSVSNDTLIVTAPSSSYTLPTNVNIIVKNVIGNSLPSNSYQYTYLPKPTVSSMDVSFADYRVGKIITLSGNYFAYGNQGGVLYSSIGNIDISYNNIRENIKGVPNNIQIVCPSVSSSYVGGKLYVTVTTMGGTSDICNNVYFIYYTNPVVSVLDVSLGPLIGGTKINVQGQNFGNMNNVLFGNTIANFQYVDETRFTTTTPSRTNTGTVDLFVKNPQNTSIANSNDKFTYLPIPIIDSIDVSYGSMIGGTTVNITGSGLSYTNDVSFGTLAAKSFNFVNDNLVTTVSPLTNTPGSVNITITTPGGSSAISSNSVFNYLSYPVINYIDISYGLYQGGTTVNIYGNHFENTSNVTFDGLSASYTVSGDTQLIVTSPAISTAVQLTQKEYSVYITVTNDIGTSKEESLVNTFNYLPQPVITSIQPNKGKLNGGTLININGIGFIDIIDVSFGKGTNVNYNIITDTSMQITSPAYDVSGKIDILITTGGGVSNNSVNDNFYYLSQPTISSIDVSYGPLSGGSLVTITGTDLSFVSDVSFGTISASSFNLIDINTITATSPDVSNGQSVDITLKTVGGTSATTSKDIFHYLPLPVISSIDVSYGPLSGGSLVTIRGNYFSYLNNISFGTIPASSYVFVSDSIVTATSPTVLTAQSVDITLTTPGGTSATSSKDIFQYLPVPAISTIDVSYGPLTGGSLITVTGTDLSFVTNVSIGTVSDCSYSLVNNTTFRVYTPAVDASQDIHIIATTPGGTTASTSNDLFHYLPVPTISSIDISYGLLIGFTDVNITGKYFTHVSNVLFGTQSALNVTFIDDNNIKATSPSVTDPQTVDIEVITPGGTSIATTNDKFTYLTVPQISTIDISCGPLSGGTIVTISGSYLYFIQNVYFGGVSSSFTSINSNELQVVTPAFTDPSSVNIFVYNIVGPSIAASKGIFNFLAKPTISSIDISYGSIYGNTLVNITGTGLYYTSDISFGNIQSGSYTVSSDQSISVYSPSASSAGIVDITITTPGGVSNISSNDKFQYFNRAVVSNLNPSSGYFAGGDRINITGFGFTYATNVLFGTYNATSFQVVNDSRITAVTPNIGSIQQLHIFVITPGNISDQSVSNLFQFLPKPIITQINPLKGTPLGGSLVTLYGYGFTNTNRVTFNNKPVSNFKSYGDNIITTYSPSMEKIIYDVSTVHINVTTPIGSSTDTSTNIFTYSTVNTGNYSNFYNNSPMTGKVYAIYASGGFAIAQGFPTIKYLNNYVPISVYDVTNAIQVLFDVKTFNQKIGVYKDSTNTNVISTSFDMTRNIFPTDYITIHSNEFVTGMSSRQVVSVGTYSTLYSDFNNYVNNYFSYSGGFASLFAGNSDYNIHNGVFDAAAFMNIITERTVGFNGSYVSAVQGSITISNINNILKYLTITNIFDNRSSVENTTKDGFIAGDLIIIPSGTVITLSLSMDNIPLINEGPDNVNTQGNYTEKYGSTDYTETTIPTINSITRTLTAPLLIILQNL